MAPRSLEHPIEHAQVQPQDGVRPVDVRECITDLSQFPLRLLPEHLMAIFEIGPSRFYELKKAHMFDRFVLRPTIGRTAWSRTLVSRYLRGEGGSSRFAASVIAGGRK